MKRLIHSLKSQSIGVVALFVALGGTGYAAISIPKSSVGSRQLRNGAVTTNKIAKGAVTAAKLSSGSIAGSVAFWARIDQNGQIVASSEPATTNNWSFGLATVSFRAHLSSKCVAIASALPTPGGNVDVFASPGAPGTEGIQVQMLPNGAGHIGPLSVSVAVVCPN
jgi:hypothetical protein